MSSNCKLFAVQARDTLFIGYPGCTLCNKITDERSGASRPADTTGYAAGTGDGLPGGGRRAA